MSDVQNNNAQTAVPALEYLFHPRSIAIVGVSRDLTKWNWGREFLESILEAGYKGKIYPVGLGHGEVLGLKIYPHIQDVPDTVDYVISAIPAQFTPQLIADCAIKGVKAIQMCTAGFSEIGNEEEKELESRLAVMARQNGIRVIGPNCLGLHYPKQGLAFHTNFTRKSGSVGLIAQSGGNSSYAIRGGEDRGIYFGKVISYGNACDLNETDFLEYLTEDPETEIIALYVEGVKDGRRFFKALRKATSVKPVIVYKGGFTEGGTRAAASHTGAIAGSTPIWYSVLKQAGAIQVSSMEELLDVVLLFNRLSPPRGNNVALVGLGGGFSVWAADACSSAGLTMPTFPLEIRRKLEEICTTEAGSSFKNPVDMFTLGRGHVIQNAVKIIADYDRIDLLIIHLPFVFVSEHTRAVYRAYTRAFTDLTGEIGGRTVIILHLTTSLQAAQIVSEMGAALSEAGFPVYHTVTQAVTAISRFIRYHRGQKMRDDNL